MAIQLREDRGRRRSLIPAALVTGSGTITFAENGRRPIASLKHGDLFELFEFTHLCGDGSLAGIELPPV